MGEAVAAGAIFGGIVGMILGLIVLGIGMKNEKTGVAIDGFFVVLVSGIVLGLIGAVPAFIIFLIAARKK